jgi:hypothetical protein
MEYIQLNLVMSNLIYSKFRCIIFNLIFSFYLKFQCVEISGISEVAFQFLIYKSIQIMFIMSKLSIKSINKLVQVSMAWPPVFTASGEIYFDNC